MIKQTVATRLSKNESKRCPEYKISKRCPERYHLGLIELCILFYGSIYVSAFIASSTPTDKI